MTDVPFQISPLANHHIRTAFQSGEEALDRYLKTQAGQEIRRGYAGVFAVVRRGENTVRGYYTLSAASVMLSSLPDSIRKHLPRYGHVPAVLLGRLAVDTEAQGKGLGALLLADALQRSCRLLDDLGWAFFIVKAKHETAAGFYAHFGFAAFPGDPLMLYLNKEAALHTLDN